MACGGGLRSRKLRQEQNEDGQKEAEAKEAKRPRREAGKAKLRRQQPKPLRKSQGSRRRLPKPARPPRQRRQLQRRNPTVDRKCITEHLPRQLRKWCQQHNHNHELRRLTWTNQTLTLTTELRRPGGRGSRGEPKLVPNQQSDW